MRNIPVLHEEPKKQRGILLTDTAWSNAIMKAQEKGISASEYIESLLREDGK